MHCLGIPYSNWASNSSTGQGAQEGDKILEEFLSGLKEVKAQLEIHRRIQVMK